MIDLHTHTLLSDGELLPSELVHRAEVKGYEAIALADHADWSNIDFIIPRIVRICKVLNRRWKICAIPGVEITHAPLEEIQPLVRFARKSGAKVVIVHGETMSEPVIPGTNRCAIEAGCDILAHPGLISKKDAQDARAKGVYLEITTRKNHSRTNRHVYKLAKSTGARLVLNNDAHSGDDLVTLVKAQGILRSTGASEADIAQILRNSRDIVVNKLKKR